MNLNEIQTKINKFTDEKGIKSNANIRILDLISEIGELSKEILKSTNYGEKKFTITDDYKSEIGDVFFSLLCLANETDVDLEDCLTKVIDKYEKRFESIGSVGSGK
ncbi:MazG nucleotide pyrophosphohydrolase domain-containing protein [Clostridiaceae bacterium M8S5]|nr:MazG nucleotide pyrophosphohydrolase domain-containing protein [Clostridiaceae bacterium M8S5]